MVGCLKWLQREKASRLKHFGQLVGHVDVYESRFL